MDQREAGGAIELVQGDMNLHIHGLRNFKRDQCITTRLWGFNEAMHVQVFMFVSDPSGIYKTITKGATHL